MRKSTIIVITLFAILLSVGVVLAVLYYYDWTVTFTYAVPDVRFYRWSDGLQVNTVDLPFTIYGDAWVIHENTSYGIRNNAADNKTVYLWVSSCNNTNAVANFTVQILNETGDVLCTWTTADWSNLGESYSVSWNADVNGMKTDTVKVVWKGSSSTADVQVALKLKTEE